MQTYIRIRSSLLIAAAAISTLVAAGLVGWWFLERTSVASYRHALNFQEPSKDELQTEINASCRTVNEGRIWVVKGDKKYIRDPFASSPQVYRYLVLDSTVLKNEACIFAIINASKRIKYSVSLVFSNEGTQVANFHFFNKE